MNANVFFQIKKVDEAKRLVIGRAADETPDRADEIFDYETSKPYFQAWSEKIHKASDGKSLGNIRSMHGKVAAGKLVDIVFDDTAKAIDIAAKIVDDNEWEKVLEGVHTGFSIAGNYVGERWQDAVHKGARRYTADPSEISLVDVGCNPSALFFDIQKADGTVLQKSFVQPAAAEPVTGEMIGNEMERMLKDGTVSLPEMLAALKAAEVAKAAPVQKPVEQAAETAATVTAPEAVRKDTETLPVPSVGNLVNLTFGDRSAQGVITENIESTVTVQVGDMFVSVSADRLKHVPADTGPVSWNINAMPTKALSSSQCLKAAQAALEKGMYQVGCFARILSDIDYLQQDTVWEAQAEGDGSTMPVALKGWLMDGGKLLTAMVGEEVAELAGDDEEVTQVIELSDHARDLIKIAADAHEALAKAGARHSAADMAHLQKAHDSLNELGAACKADHIPADATDDGDIAGQAGKVAETVKGSLNKGVEAKLDAALTKMDTLTADLAKTADERDGLLDQLKKVTTDYTMLEHRLKKVEGTPAAAKGKLLVVGKGEDYVDPNGAAAAAKVEEADITKFIVRNDRGELDDAASMLKLIQAKRGIPLAKP